MSDKPRESSERNRRTLLSHYTIRSIFYTAVFGALILAFVFELTLIGSPKFPQFLVYPLLFATAAPALFFLYSAIFWWKLAGYVLSPAIENIEVDSLADLNEKCLNLARQGAPVFVLPGGRRLDAQALAVGILVVTLVSLPVSYYAAGLHPSFSFGVLIALLYLGGVALVVFLLYAIASSQKRAAMKLIDEEVASMRDIAEQFRLASSQQVAQKEEVDQRVQILMHALTTKIIGELDRISAMKVWMTPAQRKDLAGVSGTINASALTLGLSMEAARMLAAYKNSGLA